MGKYSASKGWEDLNKRPQKSEYQELEGSKVAAKQAVRAQVEGLPSLAPLNTTLWVSGPQYLQDSEPTRQDDVPELEDPGYSQPQYRRHTPLTPTSDNETPELDSNEQIRHLQKEVIQKESKIKRLESHLQKEVIQKDSKIKRLESHLQKEVVQKESKIKRLESEVEVEKDKRRRLQAEHHEAEEAQRIVEDQDTNIALESAIARYRRPDRDVELVLEGEAQDALSSSSRKEDKGTTGKGKAFVSIPKNGNRRALFFLS